MTATGSSQESATLPNAALAGETLVNREFLSEFSVAKMPFGKYEGTRLVDLPEAYVVWFARNGFPEGKLGRMLAIVHEIKINGLEYLFKERK